MKMLIVALLLALVAVPAMGGSPFTEPLPSDYVEHGQYATLAADTLWFTTLQANAAAGLSFDGGAAETADQFPPADIPFIDSNGIYHSVKVRPVRFVQLFSREPFSLRVFTKSGATENTVYTYVDTVRVDGVGAVSTKGNKFPCMALVQGFPDSMYIKEAGSDTVWFDLGY